MPQGTAVLVHLIQCQFHYQIAPFVAAAHRLEAQLLHQLVVSVHFSPRLIKK